MYRNFTILISIPLLFLVACNYISESTGPTHHLKCSGSYNKNFWGDKWKIHGTITNSANSATFYDAKLKVWYLAKTGTVIHSEDYIIYDNFPPNTSTNFELKINDYQNARSINWEVVDAKCK